jgi:hypothetical protein
MVLGYNYSKQKKRWQRTNAPHLPAILMATVVHRGNTDGIAQCGMSTVTPDATGRQHQATTCSVLPQYSMIALMDISQVWIVTNKH